MKTHYNNKATWLLCLHIVCSSMQVSNLAYWYFIVNTITLLYSHVMYTNPKHSFRTSLFESILLMPQFCQQFYSIFYTPLQLHVSLSKHFPVGSQGSSSSCSWWTEVAPFLHHELPSLSDAVTDVSVVTTLDET